MEWVRGRYYKKGLETQDVARAGSNNSPRKSPTDVLPETTETDSEIAEEAAKREQAAKQHKMKRFNSRLPKSDSGNVSAVPGTGPAQPQAKSTDAGWEKRLAALESLEIERRLKQLESVNLARLGIQPGHDASDDFKSHCAPTLQAMVGQDSMPAAVTTDSVALSDLEAEAWKLDDATADLQAMSVMDTLHKESSVLVRKAELLLHQESVVLAQERENYEQLRHEVEGLQRQFDSAFHELSVRCQILERQCRGLVNKGLPPPQQSFSIGAPTVSDQQNLNHCLSSTLSRIPQDGPQLQVLPNDSMDGVGKPS
eukprot:CAMPEP_0172872558 /NCGR_PEP_ID=MMETSP1075-20121228/92698_1 /TAXON_ID=2916 /ORGANISM="Ceratium fusus, Strain PA161109" /LENGTH=311 /DNA_ID=CAMNT_0013722891 /DNA_START=22 /DNA_END=957 /DNA_ORIENTATION=+